MLQCYDRRAFLQEYLLHTEAAGAAPPDAFGPFRVLHQIGAGALGPVFRAYDPDEDRLVAVKLFQLELDTQTAGRLVDAFQHLIDRDLAHPAMTTPVATGLVNGSVYLAQDFAAADSLETVAREAGPAPVLAAARLAAQLAGVLDFAAAVGVWHGALHPRDILLASDDARLTGCGVVQALEAAGVVVPARGRYAAPERRAGLRWDRRADVFSLAAIVAEMVAAGESRGVAQPGDPSADSRSADAEAGRLDPPDVDRAALDRVLATAMAERPDDRYQTALAFADALKQVVVHHRHDGEAERTGVMVPARVADGIAEVATKRLEQQLPLDVSLDDLLPGDQHPLPADPDLSLTMAGPGGAADDWELRSSLDGRRDPATVDALAATSAVASPAASNPDAGRDIPSSPLPARPSSDRVDRAPSGGADRPAVESGGRRSAERPLTAPGAGTASPTSGSSVWPITLALTVGLIVGVAIGFFGFGDRPTAEPTVASAVDVPAPPTVTPAAPPAAEPAVAAPTPAPGGTPRVVENPAAPAPERPAETATSAGPAPETNPAATRPAPAAGAVGQEGRAAEAPTRNPPLSGRLLIRSSPAGAQVLVDGQEVGTTPVTLRALAFGTHTVRLARDGYAPEERRVTLSTAQPAQSLAFDLTQSRGGAAAPFGGPSFSAPLHIESRPAGAEVFIDGRRMGTTPLTVDAVAAGSHVVRLELDGYRRWSSAVRVATGERNRVTASLEQ